MPTILKLFHNTLKHGQGIPRKLILQEAASANPESKHLYELTDNNELVLTLLNIIFLSGAWHNLTLCFF